MKRAFMQFLSFPLWVILLVCKLNRNVCANTGVITIEDVKAYLDALEVIEFLAKRQGIASRFDRMAAKTLLDWIALEKQGAQFMMNGLIGEKVKLSFALSREWEVYSLPVYLFGPADLEPRE
jgi:hypothetical protein